LAVALWVMRRCGKVIGAKPFEQIVRNFSTEFFTLISDKIERGTEAANPFIKNGFGNSCRFFVL
jgi:hypothetical protein